MENNNQTMPINPDLVPEPNDAVRRMEDFGSHLTEFSPFGSDPLLTNPHLQQERNEQFLIRHQNFNEFFSTVVNGDFTLFSEGLFYFIDITRRLTV